LEELPMARPIARDAEDFARLMLQTLEQRRPEGEWIAVRELYEQTAARHPAHAYVGLVAAKPARRNALTSTLERLRAAEFPDIERRKDGGKRHAAALYRSARPAAAVVERQAAVSLDLRLPYEAPASHPLLDERRATEARGAAHGDDRKRGGVAVAPPPAAAAVAAAAGRSGAGVVVGQTILGPAGRHGLRPRSGRRRPLTSSPSARRRAEFEAARVYSMGVWPAPPRSFAAAARASRSRSF
jgi:hypothetical protein